jgi:hypothetical protein
MKISPASAERATSSGEGRTQEDERAYVPQGVARKPDDEPRRLEFPSCLRKRSTEPVDGQKH